MSFSKRAEKGRLVGQENFGEELIKRFAEFAKVENPNNLYSDYALKVGERVFHVHKLVLNMSSEYFTKKAFETGTPDLQHINPDHFLEVLRYMYTGTLLVSKHSVESLLVSGDILKMVNLTSVCNRYMTDTVAIDNALLFWRLANVYNNEILAAACRLKVETDIEQLLVYPISQTLKNASTEMMIMILGSDDLRVIHEQEAASIVILWINECLAAGQLEIQPEEVLRYIRWSGVDVGFVKLRVMQNKFIQSDAASMAFLARVVTYLEDGIQFEGLRTFRRPSTGFENCLITLGSFDGARMITDICRFSLSRPDTSYTMHTSEELLTLLHSQSTASTYNGTVYVTNMGSGQRKQFWSYNPGAGWNKLKDMPTTQVMYGSTFFGSTLFVLGGKVDCGVHIFLINSVQSYNTTTDKWYTGGDLVHPVCNTACVTHKNAIFVFGGEDKDKMPVNYVQVYDTDTKSCALMEPMPEAHAALRAMLFETSAILIGQHTCFIYNFDSRQWQERPQFKAGVCGFAAVLDNSTIFIAGGAKLDEDDWPDTLSMCDEIKSVSVLELFADKEKPEWKHLANFETPGMVSAYVSIALRMIDNTLQESISPCAEVMKIPEKVKLSSEDKKKEELRSEDDEDDIVLPVSRYPRVPSSDDYEEESAFSEVDDEDD